MGEEEQNDVTDVQDEATEEEAVAETAAPPWYWGTGRRKASIARVRVRPGTGQVIVNKKPVEVYFPIERHRVRAISLSRRYRPGDQVRAALPIGLKLVSITRALQNDVLYEVAWAQTRRRVVAFSDVAPP